MVFPRLGDSSDFRALPFLRGLPWASSSLAELACCPHTCKGPRVYSKYCRRWLPRLGKLPQTSTGEQGPCPPCFCGAAPYSTALGGSCHGTHAACHQHTENQCLAQHKPLCHTGPSTRPALTPHRSHGHTSPFSCPVAQTLCRFAAPAWCTRDGHFRAQGGFESGSF